MQGQALPGIEGEILLLMVRYQMLSQHPESGGGSAIRERLDIFEETT